MALERASLSTHRPRLAREFRCKREEIEAVLRETYGVDAVLWRKRWRLFFLATEGLFGDKNGEEWGVSHYRLRASSNG